MKKPASTAAKLDPLLSILTIVKKYEMVLRAAAVTVLILVLPKTPLRVILPKREVSSSEEEEEEFWRHTHNLVGPFLRLGKLDANVTWNTVG